MKKFPITRRNFLSQEDISCHMKTFPVTERNFLSQTEISCCRKTSPATGKKFLSLEENFTQRKAFYLILKPKMSKITYNQSFSEFVEIHAISGKVLGVKKNLARRPKILSPPCPWKDHGRSLTIWYLAFVSLESLDKFFVAQNAKIQP